jgi:hypothetical protein
MGSTALGAGVATLVAVAAVLRTVLAAGLAVFAAVEVFRFVVVRARVVLVDLRVLGAGVELVDFLIDICDCLCFASVFVIF